jgi:transcriptional regulator with XRE-family HTH domain
MYLPMKRNEDEKEALKQIINRIIELKDDNNQTSYKLSYASGISSSLLYKIESSKIEPKILTLLKILNGLNISASDFFKDIDYSNI